MKTLICSSTRTCETVNLFKANTLKDISSGLEMNAGVADASRKIWTSNSLIVVGPFKGLPFTGRSNSVQALNRRTMRSEASAS
jgi:hypothetical protein